MHAEALMMLHVIRPLIFFFTGLFPITQQTIKKNGTGTLQGGLCKHPDQPDMLIISLTNGMSLGFANQ